MKLRDGTTTCDRRLDRLVDFDERSRKYPVRALFGRRPKLRSYTWRLDGALLDQGAEGACVGFGIGHELMALPAPVSPMNNAYAREILYWGAQRIDQWDGGAYPGAKPRYEGTSVLAGMKTAQTETWFDSYRWAFGLEDVLLGLGRNGPCVLGLNWYEGMSNTDAQGFIHPTGKVRGGHCTLATKINVSEEYVRGPNTWGPYWGVKGYWKLSFNDLEKLLDRQGEAVFAVGRHGCRG